MLFDTLYGGTTGLNADFPNHGGELRYQMQAVRIGDLMGVRYNIQSPSDPFRIYDVVNDPKQAVNLAPLHPELHERMLEISIGARRKGDGGWIRIYDGATIPAVSPVSTVPGLDFKSYEGYWPWLPDFRGMVPLSVGKTPQPTAEPLTRANDSGLCFEGFLSVAADGLYTLQLESDTGSSLWLHEGLAIDNDVDFAPIRSSAPLNLAAGLHPIRIHYRHRDGGANLVLKYSGPGIPLQTVPASAFVSGGPPPVLNPDAFTTNRYTGYLADVLANDSSMVPLSLASAGPSILGATTVVSNKLQFTPTAGVLGYSEFPYVASNGYQSVPGQVSATVLFWLSVRFA